MPLICFPRGVDCLLTCSSNYWSSVPAEKRYRGKGGQLMLAQLMAKWMRGSPLLRITSSSNCANAEKANSQLKDFIESYYGSLNYSSKTYTYPPEIYKWLQNYQTLVQPGGSLSQERSYRWGLYPPKQYNCNCQNLTLLSCCSYLFQIHPLSGYQKLCPKESLGPLYESVTTCMTVLVL